MGLQPGNEIRGKYNALVPEMIHDLISQGGVEVMVLHGLIDFDKAYAVDHFRRHFAVDDGGMDRAVGEPGAQRAFDCVKGCRQLLHIGLETAIVK